MKNCVMHGNHRVNGLWDKMKSFKQIKEESQSKSLPVIKKKGYIPAGFIPSLDTKLSGKKKP